MTPVANRSSILYPKHINQYLQCPERYFHERIERRPVEQGFSTALAKGIAVHEVLADLARVYEDNIAKSGAASLPFDLHDRIAGRLPRALYPTSSAWELDTSAAVEEVRHGISYLDGAARVLAAERTFQYRYERALMCPPFTLAAKVDLVLLRHDENGIPFLDVVDYKGGISLKQDPIQEIAGRITVKQNAAKYFVDVEFDYVQTTVIHTGAKATRSVVLDDAECGRRWALIKETAAAIIQGQDWKPTPSPLCEWCPFFRDGCSLAQVGNDHVGEWLDRAAV